jgi:hypothetical protein
MNPAGIGKLAGRSEIAVTNVCGTIELLDFDI